MRRWLFSWATDACETESECQLSKALFSAYLDSDKVAEILGTDSVEDIKTFHRSNVDPLEDFFAFFHRKGILHFDTNSSSAHEGTNRGIKSHSAPVLPQHTIEKATKVLSFQGNPKGINTQITMADKDGSRKLWSSLPTAKHLTDLGEALTGNEWDERNQYGVVGPFENEEWLVMRLSHITTCDSMDGDDIEDEVGVIPRFRRVRQVIRHPITGCLTCSCCYFLRVGIPCRHIMAVLCQVHGDSCKGISHNDVLVLWRNNYYKTGMASGASETKRMLCELRSNDTQGPVLVLVLAELPTSIIRDADNDIVRAQSQDDSARCLNYPTSAEKCDGSCLRSSC